MDFEGFAKATVAGVPLVVVIIGMVYWFKLFKRKDGTAVFQGNGLLLVSMGWGLLLGSMYMLTQQRPPAGGDWWPSLVYWFAVVVYGLMMGLTASGLYEVAKGIVEKMFVKAASGLLAGDKKSETASQERLAVTGE